MMRRSILLLALFVLVVSLSACGGQPAPTEALPPPPPTGEIVAPTDPFAGATAVPADRPTLPPTWTAMQAETPTPTLITLAPDLTLQALQALPTLPACEGFTYDRETTPRTFILGQSVTISWGAAQGAANYRVTLYNAAFQPLLSDLVSGTSYTFPNTVFVAGGRYGWDVRPFDSLAVQFCIPIGGELFEQLN